MILFFISNRTTIDGVSVTIDIAVLLNDLMVAGNSELEIENIRGKRTQERFLLMHQGP